MQQQNTNSEDEKPTEKPRTNSQNTDDGADQLQYGQEKDPQPQEDGRIPEHIKVAYTPIKALSTFNYDWRIKARVTKKHDKRTWKNAKSEGSLLNIELMDSFGTQIQATFFKDAADKFDPLIREGTIYLFSSGLVKLSNARYSSIKNDFCIVFDKNADIQEVPDDSSIQNRGFNFVTIKEVQQLQENDLRYKVIDIIGIIHYIGADQEVQTKTGLFKKKRMLSLADESGMHIQVCTWAGAATRFDDMEPGKHVLAIKGARVVNNYGKQLNMGDDAFYVVDPVLPRTSELLKWYAGIKYDTVKNVNGRVQEPSSHTDFDQNSTSGGGSVNQVRLIAEMIDHINDGRQGNSGGGFLGGQFVINCYASFIRNDDKVYYMACPEENCRKKVTLEQGKKPMYRCENCNKSYETCVSTYMLSAKVSDASNQSIFLNFYREQGQQLMGAITADEIKRLREENQVGLVNDAFFDAQFQPHTIVVKARITQGGYGQQDNAGERLQFFAAKVFPYTIKGENKELIKRLEIYNRINQVQCQ